MRYSENSARSFFHAHIWEEIRACLQRLNLGTRKVDDSSRHDAHANHNGALHISKYRLHSLEQNAGDVTIAELAVLAKLCRTTFADMLNRYLRYYPSLVDNSKQWASTQLLSEQECEWLWSLPRPGQKTELLAGPPNRRNVSLSRPIGPSSYQYIYGRIGLDDWTMWPLLRPGCIVRINTRHKAIARHGSWSNDYNRPIYFLEIRDGFVCGWCDLHDRQLILTPHSLSPASTRSFMIDREVEVRGRVVGYTLDCESPCSDRHSLPPHVAVGPAPEAEHTSSRLTHHARRNRDAANGTTKDKKTAVGNALDPDTFLQ